MSADKPDAGEWAREFISELGPVSEEQAAVCIDQLKWHLENFQRETLLWVKEDCVACAEIEMGHDSVLAARIANRLRTVLERLACGRK